MTAEGLPKRSRGTKCPSSASSLTLEEQEGAGNTGCWPHPRALRAKNVCTLRTQATQVQPGKRHSLRNGFTAAPCSPRCTGLVSHRRLASIVSQGLTPASGGQDHTA